MVTGIALLGVITAAIASWFVERVGEVQAASTSPARRSLNSRAKCGSCERSWRGRAGPAK
jgi:hypothetical protein